MPSHIGRASDDVSMMDTDYADFEYQMYEIGLFADNEGNNTPNNAILFSLDPLDQLGGLDNNEVAELVYYKLDVALEYEQEGADQDVGSASEGRGVFGANLEPADQLNAGGGGSVRRVADNTIAKTPNFSQSKDNVFTAWTVKGAPSFDDEGNGPGGGDSNMVKTYERNYRDITHRGPVLGNDDSIDTFLFLTCADSIINEGVVVRGELIWDVAETSDAGREFSVPESTMSSSGSR